MPVVLIGTINEDGITNLGPYSLCFPYYVAGKDYYAMLLETLPKFGLTEEGLGDYCSIFKYGAPPHGGFAIGLERITQQILGLRNVKEASLFPRDRKRVRP